MAVKICVVTSTRADYGILMPLLKKLDADPAFQLTLAATGTHLLEEFGHTVDEIIKDGFTPVEIPIFLTDGDDAVAVSDGMAEALRRFSRLFSQENFDLLLVLGDRYEIAAVCSAAVNCRLPICHLHGGETTQGAIDECYRHGITKMSSLHFPACEEYRRRVLQLGENPSRVFNVGALCVENIREVPEYPMDSLRKELGLRLEDGQFCIVTFHPITQEGDSWKHQLEALTAAMALHPSLEYIITKANADEGGSKINAFWEKYVQSHARCVLVTSLGMQRYLTALKHSSMALGNSSSGIIEAPICHVPTVNIGDRQKGRLRTESILDCDADAQCIAACMDRALNPAFRKSLLSLPSPYGDGDTAQKIIQEILRYFATPHSTAKQFYDIPVPAESQPLNPAQRKDCKR